MEEIMLSDMQKDALRELASIGAGHASTALSKMVNKEIQMNIPQVEVVSFKKAMDFVKDEKVVVGIFLTSGGISSYVLLLIPLDCAVTLTNMLLRGEPDPSKEVLSEMDKSALQEIANILICAFFDSFSELLGISVTPGPPVLAQDMPGAVMDYVLIQIGEVADQVVFFNVELKEEKKDIFGINMFLMPEPRSLKILIEKLGLGEM